MLTASGCASAYREGAADEVLAEAIPTEEELEDQLTGDRLSEAQLSAFEIRAQQKLRDLVDYLNIVGNSSLDSAFRQEAARQAEALLAPPSTEEEAEKESFIFEASGIYTLPEFMRAFPDTLLITSLTVDQPLELNGSQYRGQLSFKSSTAGDDEESTEHQARMVVQKVTKAFGEETEEVWEVLLEDIQ